MLNSRTAEFVSSKESVGFYLIGRVSVVKLFDLLSSCFTVANQTPKQKCMPKLLAGICRTAP